MTGWRVGGFCNGTIEVSLQGMQPAPSRPHVWPHTPFGVGIGFRHRQAPTSTAPAT